MKVVPKELLRRNKPKACSIETRRVLLSGMQTAPKATVGMSMERAVRHANFALGGGFKGGGIAMDYNGKWKGNFPCSLVFYYQCNMNIPFDK